MVLLRCPRCGDPMEIVGGEVTCRRGQMGLSKVVQDELEEIVQSPPRRLEPRDFRWGGRWHCPADGERMTEADGIVQCQSCQRCLPGQTLYALVELHPHKKVWR